MLEIGCGEGGVFKSFVERGCIGTGVELDEQRYAHAEHYLQEDLHRGRVRLVRKDIYTVDIDRNFEGGFHLIILKDVIEHIPDQARLSFAVPVLKWQAISSKLYSQPEEDLS